MKRRLLQELQNVADAGLVPLVDEFRDGQADNGGVRRPGPIADRLLGDIVRAAAPLAAALGQDTFFRAFRADVGSWRTAGLDAPPRFDCTRDAFSPPQNGAAALFLGPLLTTNGPEPIGHRLEFTLAVRDEPAECYALADVYPHPKNACQSMRLVSASAGYRAGNCIVLFPENVAAATRVERQRYALFFFNKFQGIYRTQTLPAARRMLDGPGSGRPVGWTSEHLDTDDCYRARCMWGYLHDYFHHQGPRPLDEHLRVKMNWYVGLLEEIKVDSQAALACLEGDLPFGPEQVEFIVLERMFRYPMHRQATRNFDAGTGVLLFSWLRDEQVLTMGAAGRYHLNWEGVPDALRKLVSAIEAIEVAPGDDKEYIGRATQMVRRFLPEGAPGARYAMTPEQRVLLGQSMDRDEDAV